MICSLDIVIPLLDSLHNGPVLQIISVIVLCIAFGSLGGSSSISESLSCSAGSKANFAGLVFSNW
jgi:hypothetical protein